MRWCGAVGCWLLLKKSLLGILANVAVSSNELYAESTVILVLWFGEANAFGYCGRGHLDLHANSALCMHFGRLRGGARLVTRT